MSRLSMAGRVWGRADVGALRLASRGPEPTAAPFAPAVVPATVAPRPDAGRPDAVRNASRPGQCCLSLGARRASAGHVARRAIPVNEGGSIAFPVAAAGEWTVTEVVYRYPDADDPFGTIHFSR